MIFMFSVRCYTTHFLISRRCTSIIITFYLIQPHFNQFMIIIIMLLLIFLISSTLFSCTFFTKQQNLTYNCVYNSMYLVYNGNRFFFYPRIGPTKEMNCVLRSTIDWYFLHRNVQRHMIQSLQIQGSGNYSYSASKSWNRRGKTLQRFLTWRQFFKLHENKVS